MTRNLWRAAFLAVTLLALGMELLAAFDGNDQTDPWTDLITTYVPWELAVAVFGALLLWVPAHFVVRYRRWVSTTEAARMLAVSRATVVRSLTDPVKRLREWGEEGAGWRRKPLSSRGDYQLRRAVVETKAGWPKT